MRIYSLFQNEIELKPVEVELHTRFQIPSFHILGLPAPEIQEARERIMAAFSASELEFPKKKVMVNLTPSSERKSGTGYDLSIALKIIFEKNSLAKKFPNEIYAWGELGLDGTVKPCGHIAKWIEFLILQNAKWLFLSSHDFETMLEMLAWRKEQRLAIPTSLNLVRLDSIKDINECLLQAISVDKILASSSSRTETHTRSAPFFDAHLLPLSPTLERALCLAMVGRHHLLLLGPKGMGKSKALEWLLPLSPGPSPVQIWERVFHLEPTEKINFFETPVRRVHANLRPQHLLGSWSNKGFQPGELSRAHGGIFIADEFLEWPRDAKECLREPLEQKKYSLTRKQGTLSLTCDIQFIGTGNLCPCGGLPPQFNSFTKEKVSCRCRASEVQQYMSKLSGPIADRIDLILIHAESPSLVSLKENKQRVTINMLREKILAGRNFCLEQFKALPSELSVPWLEANLPASAAIEKMLATVPSLRSRHKVLKLARTIQAFEQSPELRPEHLYEAAGFRFDGVNYQ